MLLQGLQFGNVDGLFTTSMYPQALQEVSNERMAANLIYKLEKQQHFLIFTVFIITVTTITSTHTDQCLVPAQLLHIFLSSVSLCLSHSLNLP